MVKRNSRLNAALLSIIIFPVFLNCQSKVNQIPREKKNVLVTKEQCVMDLGNWTEGKINKMLAEARKMKSPNERMKYIAFQFIDTPFNYESLTPIPPQGKVMVRLSSFDCITFVHYMLALSLSKNFDEFIANLVKLRFKDPEELGIDSDPIKGNILDYTNNIYLVNAVKRGMLKNCTEEILASFKLKASQITEVIRPVERMPELGGGLVVPKYGIQKVTVDYIPTDYIERTAKYIKTGDVILFVMPLESNRPATIFGHGAIAVKGKDLPEKLRKNIGMKSEKNLYFMHATKSKNTEGNPIGVNIAGQETYLDSLIYDSNKPRLLSHYSQGVGWRGIVVLRPLFKMNY